jgi:AAA+ superfamily predicted ATPase
MEKKVFFEEQANKTRIKTFRIIENNNVPETSVNESSSLECGEDYGRNVSSAYIPVDLMGDKIKDIQKNWEKSKDKKIGTEATIEDIFHIEQKKLERAYLDSNPTGLQIISAFLKIDQNKIVQMKMTFPRMMENVSLYTFIRLMEDKKSPWIFSQVKAKIGDNEYSVPDGMNDLFNIEIENGQYATVPFKPIMAVSSRDGSKNAILMFQNETFGLSLSVISNNRKDCEEVYEWYGHQMKRFNFLKNGKLNGSGEFLKISKHTWNDIVLRDGLREKIDSNIVNMFKMEPIYTANGIPSKRGFIVLGEPGTGKTTLAKILAYEMTNVTFILVTPSDISRGSRSIKNIFELAQELSPSIVFFEDADIYMAQRGTFEASSNDVLAEIMNRLDGVVPLSGVVTGISTNRPEILEKALVNRPGRFDFKIYLGPPDKKGRISLLSKYLSKVSYDKRDLEKIADDPGIQTMTPCKIEEIARRSIMKAIDAKRYEKNTQKATVLIDDLIISIKEYNEEQGLVKNYVVEETRNVRNLLETLQLQGLIPESEDVISEAAKPERIRDIFSVSFGEDFQIEDSDYEKRISKKVREHLIEDVFRDTSMRRLLRRNGVKRNNISLALEMLDESESVTLNDLIIVLTGES